ncbi:MAG: MarR family transcriptional regulator, partial [Comamonas sp.]
MFELKDLPSYDTLQTFGARYGNPDVQGLQTWLIWASATQAMISAFEANLAQASGLSQTQFFVLLLLKRNPDGLSVGALADGVSVTSQTMTRMIDRMVGAGLCSRDVDPAD